MLLTKNCVRRSSASLPKFKAELECWEDPQELLQKVQDILEQVTKGLKALESEVLSCVKV